MMDSPAPTKLNAIDTLYLTDDISPGSWQIQKAVMTKIAVAVCTMI